eukprot:2248468-Prymnesium_polylepis.1
MGYVTVGRVKCDARTRKHARVAAEHSAVQSWREERGEFRGRCARADVGEASNVLWRPFSTPAPWQD